MAFNYVVYTQVNFKAHGYHGQKNACDSRVNMSSHMLNYIQKQVLFMVDPHQKMSSVFGTGQSTNIMRDQLRANTFE